MSKKILATAFVVILGMGVLYYFSPAQKAARFMNQLVERNIDARGGAAVWKAVSTLRLSGRMDLGQGMSVPYVLEQKRPNKTRFEFIFNGATAIQSFDGKNGWQILPYRGKNKAEAMTNEERNEAADTADLYGLLIDYSERGHILELIGREQIAGRDTFKIKVTLPTGSVRWDYLDVETALEVKIDKLRTLGRKKLTVETYYKEWKVTDGLLISHRQETLRQGDKESHFLTVESVEVNSPLSDAAFEMPTNGKKEI